MSKIKCILATLVQAMAGLILFPSVAMAVGFGGISVNSKLGEPLNLEIELLSITPTEIGTLTIKLASRADFARANVAYPENTRQLTFEIVEGIDGQYFVQITSLNPVVETFLHFMITANWSGGKVVREYTALMDPPLYTGEPTSGVQVPTTFAEESDSGIEPDGSIEPASSSELSTPEAPPVDSSVSGSLSSRASVLVDKGDTLSGIVNRLGLPDSVSMYQGLTSLLEANPDAFVNGNMNRLKAGATLTIPEFHRIADVDRQMAVQNFQAQVNEYNQYLVGIGYSPTPALASVDTDEPGQQVAKAEQSAEQAEQSKEPALSAVAPGPEEESVDLSQLELTLDTVEDDVTRLSIGQETSEADGTGAADGQQDDEAQIEALKAQLAELDESLLASGVENEEVKSRLKAIQEQVDRVSTLIEIEDSSLALTQNSSVDDSDQAVAVIDETGQVDEGGESGVADTASDQDIISTDGSATEDSSIAAAAAIASSEIQPVAASGNTDGNSTESAAAIASSEIQPVVASGNPDGNSTASAADEEPVKQPEAAASLNRKAQLPADSEPVRTIASSGIMSNLASIFGSLSDYALKVVAALVVLIAGLFFYRRRKSQQEFEESMLDIESSQISSNTEQQTLRQLGAASGIDLASQDSGFELTIGGGMSYLSEEGIAGVADEENEVVQAGAVDPLAEADVYLAYDRDEQAVQVLKEAYAMNPERLELAEKLLEIYHKQDDRIAFDDLATDLRSRIGAKHHPVWTKVSAMGREVSPGNGLYSEPSELRDDSELELDTTPDPVDITLFDEGVGDIAGEGSQLDVVSLDIDEFELGSDQADQTAIKDLELGDLDMNLGGEVDEGQRALDAPTLSQIITSVEARAAGVAENATPDQPAQDTDDGAVEFKLGDPGDDEEEFDELFDLDESAELANALRELEEGMEDIQQAAVVGEEEVAALNEVAEQLAVEEVGQLADIGKRSESAAEISAQEDSFLSELSEQSISRQEPYHESETALELAKAYLELGEKDIAKGFIEEVINEGSDKQKAKAEKLVKELVE